MSCSVAKGGWEVRWRDSDGRQRSRRFKTEEAAREFDGALHEHEPLERGSRGDGHGARDGVYAYRTTAGLRWRYVVRRSDGTQTTKRGFLSEKAARDARRRVVEQVERGEVRHTKATFAEYWSRWIERRRPYLEGNTWRAYEVDGRLRLVPVLGELPLGQIAVEDVRRMISDLAELVAAEQVAAKTVNNTLGTLVVCLNAAVEDGLIGRNPALRVERLPAAHIEREYLRLHEIPLYLDSCADVYRPLAEVLIVTGMRISEALALRIGDVELEPTGGLVTVYRSRKRETIGSTKSDRFRSVEIGPGLARVLADQLARRAELDGGSDSKAALFVMPVRERHYGRGRWASSGRPAPLDRTTVSREWHKEALADAELRDMPLHSLRHTAAAAWLAAGNSLMYVQRQLGHSDIATTERYYGHLERHVLAAGAVATEEAIARAVARR
jgi:integrase